MVFYQAGQPLELVKFWDCYKAVSFQLGGQFTGALDYIHIRVEVFG